MDHIPRLGFGTYGRTNQHGVEAIGFALETGYRHLDTAQSYNNEKEVGAALAQCTIDRGDIWVTTKVDMANFGIGKLIPSLEISLEKLGGPVDLALIHWPSPNNKIALEVYLEQILDAKSQGLTRHIGVSNFPIAMLKQAEKILGKGEILTNQLELNPGFQNKTLADFCQASGILVTCYQPIAQGRLDSNPDMQIIATNHDATPSQIALAWELAKGYSAIPTSSKKDRIQSNFDALALQLTDSEMETIGAIQQEPRSIAPDWGPAWDE
ncbi:MAG: aldo/keto reductase [Alphaproteobacteria bacterium]|nr:aldo/keto reductase [Alphaproteobacteria bacterium]